MNLSMSLGQSKNLLLIVAVITLLSGCHHERYGDTLAIAKTAPYIDKAFATDAVKNDCKLDTVIPAHIKKEAEKHFDSVVLIENTSPIVQGKVLSIKIAHVLAFGGGAFGGPKGLTLNGELRDNGKVIGTFTAHNVDTSHMNTPGSMRYGIRIESTCKGVQRVSESLAKKIVDWLRAPSMNAKVT